MNLDSVRELKQSLADRVLPHIETTITARAAFGRSASPIARAAEPPPSMALGVAPDGGKGFRLAIRVQKRAFQESKEVERITRQAKGEVDVRYVGRVGKRSGPWYQARQRPLLIGSSIGHFKVTAGTIGCFVKPRAGGGVYILSNNHVLANENGGKSGDAIVQPGSLDDGVVPGDIVATLGEFIRLKKRGANFVDCALGKLATGIEFEAARLRGNGKLAGLGDAFLDEGTAVSKIGRTTGLTRGRVTAFEMDNVVVEFGIGYVRFDDQVEIEGAGDRPFSDGGDSGSLIVGKDKRGVALLFAGSDQGGENGQGLTYANPLRAVLDALKVDLVL